jgi:hypothetical protein
MLLIINLGYPLIRFNKFLFSWAKKRALNSTLLDTYYAAFVFSNLIPIAIKTIPVNLFKTVKTLELPLSLVVAIEEKYAVFKHQIPPVKVKVSPKIIKGIGLKTPVLV